MFANPAQTHESLFNRTSVNFKRLNIHPTPHEKKKKMFIKFYMRNEK